MVAKTFEQPKKRSIRPWEEARLSSFRRLSGPEEKGSEGFPVKCGELARAARVGGLASWRAAANLAYGLTGARLCRVAGAGASAALYRREAKAVRHKQAREPLPAKIPRTRSTCCAANEGQTIIGFKHVAESVHVPGSQQCRGSRLSQQAGSHRMGSTGKRRSISASAAG